MAKDIGDLIALILGLPTLVVLLILGIGSVLVSTGHMNVTDYTQQWGQTVADLVTPWWVGLVVGGGTVGAIILIVLVVLFGKGILDA
jgi:hypothetical protein